MMDIILKNDFPLSHFFPTRVQKSMEKSGNGKSKKVEKIDTYKKI